VLASLGGLRTDRGILCEPCNNGFSTIDAALADSMGPLGAMIGVHHGRTKAAIATPLEDPETGRTYVLTGGREIGHPEPVILEDQTVDGVRNLYAVASTQQQAEEFVRQLKAEGKRPEVRFERVPLLFATTPTAPWMFGGPQTYRAIAKAALNVLAHLRPARAREPWLFPLKRFVLDGGDSGPWVAYDFGVEPDSRLPRPSFRFQHRILVGFDAQAGLAYARVSLLGVVELSVVLGSCHVQQSETLVYDVDVVASRAPGDVRTHEIPGVALHPPREPVENPARFIPDRLVAFLNERNAWTWEQDAPGLVVALNDTRGCPEWVRHERIVEALEGQQQRLLNLASWVTRQARSHFVADFGPQGAAVGDAFGVVAKADGGGRTGVTDLTHAVSEQLRYVMADHLIEILNERPIEADELRCLLEGKDGAVVVAEYLVGEFRKAVMNATKGGH
jgi:hypothetical protein